MLHEDTLEKTVITFLEELKKYDLELILNDNPKLLSYKHSIRTTIKHSPSSQSSSVMIILNTQFPLDDRTFIRLRMDGGSNNINEELWRIIIATDGYIGSNSKEFLRPVTNENLWLFLGGEQNFKLLNRNEVASEIADTQSTTSLKSLLLLNDEELACNFAKVIRVTLGIDENGMFKRPLMVYPAFHKRLNFPSYLKFKKHTENMECQ